MDRRGEKNSKRGVSQGTMGGAQKVDMRTHVSKAQPEPVKVFEHVEPQAHMVRPEGRGLTAHELIWLRQRRHARECGDSRDDGPRNRRTIL